ncbi:uncharacterized protein LOC117102762 [Anneissia japonica]|uniref:uncharacterized protein LOC117102762 n=1 Tax=Anneissia japonica TaxID=1529436 RepID=UPI001425AE4B|nr:uncharacterized protein LOC117102762 [Anneissia japonica]
MPSKSKSCAASGNLGVNVKLSKSGRTTNFQLSSNKTIEDVCKQVAEEEKVSAREIIIKYSGKILNRFHKLSYLGVRPETVLKAEVVEVKKYNINVQKENGETIPMCIENINTIQEVKNMLAERLEVGSSNSVEMEVKGKKIIGKESQSAISLGLDDEALVKVKVVKRPEAASNNGQNQEENDRLDEATLQELLSSFVVEAGNNVEVVFSFDTTGSMFACLDQVRSKVEETTSRLLQNIPNIRIGIMAHGDYNHHQSKYVLRKCDLTNNRSKLIRFINDVPSTGGGDSPECYEWVLKKAQELSWTEGSARALVMIGDDVPHPPSFTDQHINWHTELDRLRDMNIKVYSVQAMHGPYNANFFFEEMAERTAGTYL